MGATAAIALALLSCANYAASYWVLVSTGLDHATSAGGAATWAIALALANDEP